MGRELPEPTSTACRFGVLLFVALTLAAGSTATAGSGVDEGKGRSAVIDFSLSKRATGKVAVEAVRRAGQIVVTFEPAVVRVPSFTGNRARFTYRVAALCAGRYGARGTAVSPVFRSAAPKQVRSVSLSLRRVGVAAPSCGKGKPVGVVVSVSADRVGTSSASLFVAATAIPSLPA
jgi:hypothetical protein